MPYTIYFTPTDDEVRSTPPPYIFLCCLEVSQSAADRIADELTDEGWVNHAWAERE
jgi:hypothetical protein